METEISEPLVSVIIPVYNAEKYLRRGLDSLLAQTNGLWEAVCIDDGSTDDSPAILREYAARDARFRVLTQENSGVSVARNRGIREAKGEWVTFLDADDWLSEDIIEALLPHTRRTNVDVIGFETEVRFEEGMEAIDGVEQGFRLKKEGEYPSLPENVNDMIGSCCGKAYRRIFLLKNSLEFPVGMRQEDEVFYRCAMGVARNMYLLKHTGYCYYQNTASYMHRHTDPGESYLLYLQGARITYEFYRKHEKSEEWARSLLSFLYTCLSSCSRVLNRRKMQELRQLTEAFMEAIHHAGLDASDYRVRYLATLPWWEGMLSQRKWNVEYFKLFGLTYRKDYYRDYKLVRRTSLWSKINDLFITKDEGDSI